jgi:cell division transport system permease protein
LKNFINNLGYFFKEARRITQTNVLSNIFTFLGTILILFLLATVVTGWSITSRLVQMLEEEAEISAFFSEDLDENEALRLADSIGKLDGVLNARVVDESEAYDQMEEILANDAGILELFDENPFNAYIEIRIQPQQIDSVLKQVEGFGQIDHVRDNRDVLERINHIVEGLNILGYLVIAAVGITTVVIISHMIRQGIYDNRDQIKTLRLLGASRMFIGFPFICVGLLITLAAGIIASFAVSLLINSGYRLMGGAIPFIPLPVKNELVLGVVIVIMGVSAILGIVGSLFGLSSIKDH